MHSSVRYSSVNVIADVDVKCVDAYRGGSRLWVWGQVERRMLRI